MRPEISRNLVAGHVQLHELYPGVLVILPSEHHHLLRDIAPHELAETPGEGGHQILHRELAVANPHVEDGLVVAAPPHQLEEVVQDEDVVRFLQVAVLRIGFWLYHGSRSSMGF